MTILHPLKACLLGASMLAACGAAAQTLPTAPPGFKVSVFAVAPPGLSNPDSVITLHKQIWVGYGDTAAPDGSSGNSNIVEFNRDGTVARILTVTGHNDGLRYNPTTGQIWAIQNEDAIPNLVTIDPMTGAQSAPTSLRPVNGGGYDDMAFIGGKTYVSASNPALNAKGINTHPAIVDLVAAGTGYVPETVLSGDSPAVNTVTGAATKLNLTDPDSLTVTPDGNLLMTDQGDAQLILLRFHGKGPYISQIPLAGGVQVDDTVYATAASGTLFISDTPANIVYKVTSKQFVLGQPYSASTGVAAGGGAPPVPAFVGGVDLKTGATTPLVIGLMAPHGLAFRAPE